MKRFNAISEAKERLGENSRLNSDPTVLAEWFYSPAFNTVGYRLADPESRVDEKIRIVNTNYPMYGRAELVVEER